MLWFLGLAAVGVGAVAWAYNSVTEEEREARRRWERKREEVEKLWKNIKLTFKSILNKLKAAMIFIF